MKEYIFNCKGYCLFRAGIDEVEQYRNINYVYELLEWFNITTSFASSKILAVAQGSKYDQPANMLKHTLIHMAHPEGSNLYSHRRDNNYPIKLVTLRNLSGEFLTELGTNHFLFLQQK